MLADTKATKKEIMTQIPVEGGGGSIGEDFDVGDWLGAGLMPGKGGRGMASQGEEVRIKRRN